MDKLIIKPDHKKISSINRTIRFNPDHFDTLMDISAKTGLSFNKVVNQCIAFAIEHLAEDENETQDQPVPRTSRTGKYHD